MHKGLFNPENFVLTGGGFREGIVKVAKSVITIVQPRAQEGETPRAPFVSLQWAVNRLDENHQEQTDDEGNTIEEILNFSFGGNSLTMMHVGEASGPDADDDEITDLGDEVGTEGPTIYIEPGNKVNLDKRSGLAHLISSLHRAGVKPEILDRVWAPDYVGMICFMTSEQDTSNKTKDRNGNDRPVSYKVVKEIYEHPGEKKKAKAPVKPIAGKGKAGAKEESNEAEEVLLEILNALAEDRAGEEFSRRAFKSLINTKMQKAKTPAKTQLAATKLLNDDKWLSKNAPVSIDDDTVTFEGGEAEEEEE